MYIYIYISYFYLLTSLGIIRRSCKCGFWCAEMCRTPVSDCFVEVELHYSATLSGVLITTFACFNRELRIYEFWEDHSIHAYYVLLCCTADQLNQTIDFSTLSDIMKVVFLIIDTYMHNTYGWFSTDISCMLWTGMDRYLYHSTPFHPTSSWHLPFFELVKLQWCTRRPALLSSRGPYLPERSPHWAFSQRCESASDDSKMFPDLGDYWMSYIITIIAR